MLVQYMYMHVHVSSQSCQICPARLLPSLVWLHVARRSAALLRRRAAVSCVLICHTWRRKPRRMQVVVEYPARLLMFGYSLAEPNVRELEPGSS